MHFEQMTALIMVETAKIHNIQNELRARGVSEEKLVEINQAALNSEMTALDYLKNELEKRSK